MTRINNNIGSIISERVLKTQTRALDDNLIRLSTGLRINRGKDDPSGLIASENLRAEQTAITQAIKNGERAESVATIAEGGLVEIQDQLRVLEGLVDSAANVSGLSDEERSAIQLQVDGVLGSIDRIANSPQFQGIRLLNGNFEFTTSGMVTSHIDEIDIYSALFPSIDSNGNAGSFTLDIAVATSAQTAVVAISAGINANNVEAFSGQTVTFEFTGANGTTQLSFASGTTATTAVSSINQFTEVTGLSAATSGNLIVVRSTDLGSDNFVSIRHIEGSAYESNIRVDDGSGTAVSTAGQSVGTDRGRDADIFVNGIATHVKGLSASLSQANLDLDMKVDSNLNTRGSTTSLVITGGGARFNLGPTSNLASKVGIGFISTTTGKLGSIENGRLAALKSGSTANVVTGDVDRAQRIVRDAINALSKQRGKLGSFITNTVRTTMNSLNIAFENTSAAESTIRDTDFAKETAELTRRQILVQTATNSLALSNARSSDVLRLLG